MMLAATVLAISACRKNPDADTGQGPYADLVAHTVPNIERSVGLPFKRPPTLQTRSKEQVRQFLIATISDTASQRELRGSQTAYTLLGLLPDTLDFQKLLINLLTEQVVGFYDPKTKVLYVVEGAQRDMVTMTVTHELVHALQDQYIDLDSIQSLHDNDRKMAAQAVFEGEALYEQFAANGISLDIPGGWSQVREMVRKNQSSMPIFASAPPLIRETLLFPYLDGAAFMKEYKTRRGAAVPFADMPQSTEQILDPNAYFTARDTPTTVSFAPLPAELGATVTYTDDLGAFETSILAFGVPSGDAPRRLATGWDGDRYLVVATAKGNALVWASVWDSPAAAKQMDATLRERLVRVPPAGRQRSLTAGEVQGRPVLLYVDVPRGINPKLVPFASVRLSGGAPTATTTAAATPTP